jgi:hypothetical protein
VYEVPVAEISPSPRNPRHEIQGNDEPADSIRTHGLLQPILTPYPHRNTYLVNLLAEVASVLDSGVSERKPKARRALRAMHQRLALLVGD